MIRGDLIQLPPKGLLHPDDVRCMIRDHAGHERAAVVPVVDAVAFGREADVEGHDPKGILLCQQGRRAEKVEKAEKGGAEHVIKGRGLISLHEEPNDTFFIAKKVSKKSSASKNSLLGSIIRLAFWFAFSLGWISRYPFLRLYGHKKGHPVGSDNFGAPVYTSRNDFFDLLLEKKETSRPVDSDNMERQDYYLFEMMV